jgi:neuroligin
MSEDRRDRSLRTLIRNFYQFHLNEIYYVLRNEYTDWDRPSALDALSMRDSLSLALSDALVVAPLMHVVHLHAQRSANPSGTFFYHYQGQQQQQQQQTIMTQPPTINVGQQQNNDADLSEYNVRITSPSIFLDFKSLSSITIGNANLFHFVLPCVVRRLDNEWMLGISGDG